MKKFVCLLTVLLLCMTLALPAFAAENGFVPSITYKPNPEIVPVQGEDGGAYAGVIRDADGNVIGYIDAGCLLITPIAHIWDEEEYVPAEVERLLQFVYDSLNDGSMEIPYEKHEADLDPAYMVIRDLFDARWYCEEHPKMLEPEGVVLELIFDLGVVADVEIFVQTYDEAANEWSPIVSVENNGDGTVTCVFEHLCAIEFSMPVDAPSVPSEEVQSPSILPWIIALIIAIIAFIIILIAKKEKKEEKETV